HRQHRAVVEQVIHVQAEGQLVLGKGRAVFHTDVDRVLPRIMARIAGTCRLASAPVIVVAITGWITLIRAVTTQTAARRTRLDQYVAREHPLRRHLPRTVGLQLVATTVG